ncbi:MAG: hypothetical protein JSS24_04340 [Proteobacteria bacterium]|nr:hypothetical protein [Pseudomonadota bacterium]
MHGRPGIGSDRWFRSRARPDVGDAAAVEGEALLQIKQLEDASGDAQAKCSALWVLITTGKSEDAVALIDASTPRAP